MSGARRWRKYDAIAPDTPFLLVSADDYDDLHADFLSAVAERERLEERLVDAEHELADLHDSIRTAYAQCPQLPISAEHPEDFDKATDALHSLCLLVGIHGIEVTRAVTVEGKGNG